jgi:hydrogenase maturation protease
MHCPPGAIDSPAMLVRSWEPFAVVTGSNRRVIRKALIIGYGNSLRGDDGIGRAAAEALVGGFPGDAAEVVSCHQLVPELAERLAAVTLAVFIDAASGMPAGSIAVSGLGDAPAPASGLVHHLDPASLLAMAGKLYGSSPAGFLVSVGAGSMAIGEPLSAAVAAALPEVVATVRRLVLEHLPAAPPLDPA